MPPSYSTHSWPSGECVVIVMPLSRLGLDALFFELALHLPLKAHQSLEVFCVGSFPSSFAFPWLLELRFEGLLRFPLHLCLLIALVVGNGFLTSHL